VPNNIKTKHLLERAESIEDLAEKRGLTIGTILNHLAILKKDDSSLDLDKFKPQQELMEKISEKVAEIKANKKNDDFSEHGQIRLKPIFEALDGKVSYDEIKLALFFIEL